MRRSWMTLTVVGALGCASDADSTKTKADTEDEMPSDTAVDDTASQGGGTESPATTVTYPQGPLATPYDGNLIAADYWSDTPKILSAGVGFADIVGVVGDVLDQELVRSAGGAWSTAHSCGPDVRHYTSVSLQSGVALAFIHETPYGDLEDGAIGLDGLPVVFSWPMDTRTLDITDFRLTLSTGEVVTPKAAGPYPCAENNERNVAVLFGEFANRLPSTDPAARFPVRVEVVADDDPLMLVGPGGEAVSAVGLFKENSTSPYDPDNGPRLVGAKLNHIGEEALGEGISNPASAAMFVPNDELVLYDEGDFRLRILTSGGFSPDGIRGVLPTDFETFFRIHAVGEDGEDVLIENAGVSYAVRGGTLRVVGLAELGAPEGETVVYDGCYGEDKDNYIDIILAGDEAAARNITYIEIPSREGGYGAFYNPGGPGSTPFDGVTYTSPGPRDMEPVLIALDDPMRVTRTID